MMKMTEEMRAKLNRTTEALEEADENFAGFFDLLEDAGEEEEAEPLMNLEDSITEKFISISEDLKTIVREAFHEDF